MLAELDGLSSGQWGLVTTAQAERRGVSRLQMSRLASAGHLRRVGQGVYLDAGSPEGPFTHVQAAWLSAEPGRTAEERVADPGAQQVVVGGATAAFLHEVGDLQPEPVELLVDSARRSRRPGVRYRRRRVPAGDVAMVAGLPVTTIPETIADLIEDQVDLSLVADLLRDAVQDRRVALSAVAAAVDADVFRRLVEAAGLDHDPAERSMAALAARVTDLLGPDYLASLTRSVHEMVTGMITRDLLGTTSPDLLAGLTRDVGADVLPPGLADSLRRQVTDSIRPALEGVRAVAAADVLTNLTSKANLAVPPGLAARSQWAAAVTSATARAAVLPASGSDGDEGVGR